MYLGACRWGSTGERSQRFVARFNVCVACYAPKMVMHLEAGGRVWTKPRITKSENPYARVLMQLCRFLACRPHSKFNRSLSVCVAGECVSKAKSHVDVAVERIQERP